MRERGEAADHQEEATVSAADQDGFPSRGGSTMKKEEDILPPPRAGEPTACSRVSCGRASVAGGPQLYKGMACSNEVALKQLESVDTNYKAEDTDDKFLWNEELVNLKEEVQQNENFMYKGMARSDEVALKQLESAEVILQSETVLEMANASKQLSALGHTAEKKRAENDVLITFEEHEKTGILKAAQGRNWNSMRPKLEIKLKKPKATFLPGSIFDDLTSQETSVSSANVQSARRTGYGDPPHPPPFYKCHVCKKRTAIYHLKCCTSVTCEMCWCYCYLDGICSERVKLPMVKLEGKDIMLWQSFKLPSDLILFKAKGTDRSLKYFFISIDNLIGDKKMVPITVYHFNRDGIRVMSWSVSKETISRADLA